MDFFTWNFASLVVGWGSFQVDFFSGFRLLLGYDFALIVDSWCEKLCRDFREVIERFGEVLQ